MNCLICGIIGFLIGFGVIAVGILVYAYVWKKDILDAYNRGKKLQYDDFMPEKEDKEDKEGDYIG